jgi:hypothetical protein
MDDVINENKPFIVLPSNTSESEVWKQNIFSPEMRDDGYHNLSRVKHFWARTILSSPQGFTNPKVYVSKNNVKYLTPLLVVGCYAFALFGAGPLDLVSSDVIAAQNLLHWSKNVNFFEMQMGSATGLIWKFNACWLLYIPRSCNSKSYGSRPQILFIGCIQFSQ